LLHLGILDRLNLFKGLQKISLVNVVDDQLLETTNSFRKLDAFFNLAMGLEHLEDGVLIDVLSIFFDKGPQLILLRLHSSLQHELGFSSCGADTGLHLVDFLKLKLDNPRAKQHSLRRVLLLILFIHTKNCKQVDLKVALLIF
jgi:hypothetical protein